jgi:hypothetical protein
MLRTCALASRILVLFTVFLLLAMPWTEYFCHFDNFPYGGDDFELSVFVLVSLLGLVLVLLQHDKRSMDFVPTLTDWLLSAFQRAGSPVAAGFDAFFASLHAPPIPCLVLSKYNLPIQV